LTGQAENLVMTFTGASGSTGASVSLVIIVGAA